MPVAIIGPKFYVWNSNGDPIEGAEINTFETDGVTRKETFNAENGSANSNPTITNAAGYASLYLDGVYAISVYDPDGNLVYSENPVTSANELAQVWTNKKTATFATTSSFTIAGNYTDVYKVGRRVQLDDATMLYGTITASSYSSPNTTVTVSIDDGTLLTANLDYAWVYLFESGDFAEEVANLSALRGINGRTGYNYVFVQSHTDRGDGGNGNFRWVSGAAPGTYVDNNGTIIVPTGGDGSAAWLRDVTDVIYSDQFGIIGSGDETQKFQNMVSFACDNFLKWHLTKRITVSETTYIDNNYSRGECIGDGEIVFTGAGFCIDFTPKNNIYLIGLDLRFVISLTASNQYAMAERFSSSEVNLTVDMNDVACTNCIGLRSLGDVTYGTGPYYNTVYLFCQGLNQSGTIMHTTEPDDGVFTGNRGPNANYYIIERSGQFVQHVLNRIGTGNTWDIRTVEGGTTAVTEGHDSNSSYCSQNRYIFRYLENTTQSYVSPSGKFCSSTWLDIQMTTGGGAISDLATNANGEIGAIVRRRANNGFFEKIDSARSFEIKGRTNVFPKISNPNTPSLDFFDSLGGVNTLRIGSNAGTSQATRSVRMLINGVEFVTGGLGGWFPPTDSTHDLGSVSLRWEDCFAEQIRPGSGAAIWTSGAGTPEGSVTAGVGSMFTRTDGGAGTTLYVKETGTGNTGWVAK